MEESYILPVVILVAAALACVCFWPGKRDLESTALGRMALVFGVLIVLVGLPSVVRAL